MALSIQIQCSARNFLELSLNTYKCDWFLRNNLHCYSLVLFIILMSETIGKINESKLIVARNVLSHKHLGKCVEGGPELATHHNELFILGSWGGATAMPKFTSSYNTIYSAFVVLAVSTARVIVLESVWWDFGIVDCCRIVLYRSTKQPNSAVAVKWSSSTLGLTTGGQLDPMRLSGHTHAWLHNGNQVRTSSETLLAKWVGSQSVSQYPGRYS